MSRMWRPALLVMLVVWAGGSCSDLGVLSPPSRGAVTIGSLSLSEGSFTAPGEAVRFVIQTQESRDTESRILELEVALQDGEGNGVWSARVASPLLNEELSLTLPELPTGAYRLTLRVNGEEGLLQEKKLAFFCLAGQYAITGISSYPPTIMPNREGRITAAFLHPEGTDPYVRWTRDGALLASGRLSQGLAELTWLAPRAEGVYTVQVELFPVAPAAGTDFPTVSPIHSSARLFVSSKPVRGADELGPLSSYFALFHFDGSLADEAGGGQAELVGSARLVDSGPAAGYFLPAASGAGIRYQRSILPLQEGRLQPCTLTLVLIPSQQGTGENLLSVLLPDPTAQADGGGFALRIVRGSDGELAALIGAPDAPTRLPSGITSLEPARLSRLDLTLIPDAASLRALWFLDGRQTAAHRVSFSAGAGPAGETLLGGENNVELTVTELGVYYRDESQRPAVDPAIYRVAAERRYGSRLVLAEGFEGLYAPESWTVSGEALPAAGLLLLPAGASLKLPYFELGAGETLLSLQFGEDPPADARISLFWESQNVPFAVLEPRGLLTSPLRPKQPVSLEALGSRVELVLSEASLALSGSPEGLPLAAPSGKASWLTVQIDAPPAAEARSAPQSAPAAAPRLRLDSILIYRK